MQAIYFQLFAYSSTQRPTPHFLLFQSLPHSFHRDGGCTSSSYFGNPPLVTHCSPLPSTPFLSYSCALFCLLLHFFALARNSTLSFSIPSALFAKKRGYGGSSQSTPPTFHFRIPPGTPSGKHQPLVVFTDTGHGSCLFSPVLHLPLPTGVLESEWKRYDA